MAQLPGRISIRPLAKFVNRPKTHSVQLRNDKIQVDIKYPYQTLRNQVDYKDVSSIHINMDDVGSNPLSRDVRIMTKNRQMYDIPNMDSVQAMKLKDAIETQQHVQIMQSKQDKKQNVKSTSRVSPIAKFRR